MAPEDQPTHLMRGTAAEIWGADTHEVMYTTATDWDTDDFIGTLTNRWTVSFLSFVIFCFAISQRRKLIILT